MRWLALAVLGACSFSPGVMPGGTSLDAAIADTNMVVVADAPDGGVPPPGKVRSIDIVDAQVATGPHTDFPLLVSIAAQPWLKSAANAGDVARDDGFDIRFTADQAGTMPLAHDVEVYDPVAGTLVAWVKVPSLAADTVVYIQYGDPANTTDPQNVTGVWTGGYELVVHMDGTGDAAGKNVANQGSNIPDTAGKVGRARAFDGAASFALVNKGAAIDNIFTGGGVAEGWFFATTFGEQSKGRIFDKGDTAGWALFVVNDSFSTASVSFVHGAASQEGQWYGPANAVTTGAWHHVALLYDQGSSSNNPTVMLDGVAIAMSRSVTPSGAMVSDAANDLYLGNNAGASRTFDGALDELRLSSATRTPGWITTEYRNQAAPTAFYTVSAPL